MNEYACVVNDDDEIIDYKLRNDIDPVRDIFRVTGVWVKNSKNEVLLAQRKWTKKNDPGLWGPAVSGTVEKGETYESNARKEVFEEIGVSDIELKPIAKLKQELPRKQFIQVYLALIDKEVEDFVIQDAEVEEVKWISSKQLIEGFSSSPQKYVPSMAQFIELEKTKI